MPIRLAVGDAVEVMLPDVGVQTIGLIRFIGIISSFGIQHCVGLELLEAIDSGHNGVIDGYRYFTVEDGFGMHIRLDQIIKKLTFEDLMHKLKTIMSEARNRMVRYRRGIKSRDEYITKLKRKVNNQRMMLEKTRFNSNGSAKFDDGDMAFEGTFERMVSRGSSTIGRSMISVATTKSSASSSGSGGVAGASSSAAAASSAVGFKASTSAATSSGDGKRRKSGSGSAPPPLGVGPLPDGSPGLSLEGESSPFDISMTMSKSIDVDEAEPFPMEDVKGMLDKISSDMDGVRRRSFAPPVTPYTPFGDGGVTPLTEALKRTSTKMKRTHSSGTVLEKNVDSEKTDHDGDETTKEGVTGSETTTTEGKSTDKVAGSSTTGKSKGEPSSSSMKSDLKSASQSDVPPPPSPSLKGRKRSTPGSSALEAALAEHGGRQAGRKDTETTVDDESESDCSTSMSESTHSRRTPFDSRRRPDPRRESVSSEMSGSTMSSPASSVGFHPAGDKVLTGSDRAGRGSTVSSVGFPDTMRTAVEVLGDASSISVGQSIENDKMKRRKSNEEWPVSEGVSSIAEALALDMEQKKLMKYKNAPKKKYSLKSKRKRAAHKSKKKKISTDESSEDASKPFTPIDMAGTFKERMTFNQMRLERAEQNSNYNQIPLHMSSDDMDDSTSLDDTEDDHTPSFDPPHPSSVGSRPRADTDTSKMSDSIEAPIVHRRVTPATPAGAFADDEEDDDEEEDEDRERGARDTDHAELTEDESESSTGRPSSDASTAVGSAGIARFTPDPAPGFPAPPFGMYHGPGMGHPPPMMGGLYGPPPGSHNPYFDRRAGQPPPGMVGGGGYHDPGAMSDASEASHLPPWMLFPGFAPPGMYASPRHSGLHPMSDPGYGPGLLPSMPPPGHIAHGGHGSGHLPIGGYMTDGPFGGGSIYGMDSGNDSYDHRNMFSAEEEILLDSVDIRSAPGSTRPSQARLMPMRPLPSPAASSSAVMISGSGSGSGGSSGGGGSSSTTAPTSDTPTKGTMKLPKSPAEMAEETCVTDGELGDEEEDAMVLHSVTTQEGRSSRARKSDHHRRGPPLPNYTPKLKSTKSDPVGGSPSSSIGNSSVSIDTASTGRGSGSSRKRKRPLSGPPRKTYMKGLPETPVSARKKKAKLQAEKAKSTRGKRKADSSGLPSSSKKGSGSAESTRKTTSSSGSSGNSHKGSGGGGSSSSKRKAGGSTGLRKKKISPGLRTVSKKRKKAAKKAPKTKIPTGDDRASDVNLSSDSSDGSEDELDGPITAEQRRVLRKGGGPIIPGMTGDYSTTTTTTTTKSTKKTKTSMTKTTTRTLRSGGKRGSSPPLKQFDTESQASTVFSEQCSPVSSVSAAKDNPYLDESVLSPEIIEGSKFTEAALAGREYGVYKKPKRKGRKISGAADAPSSVPKSKVLKGGRPMLREVDSGPPPRRHSRSATDYADQFQTGSAMYDARVGYTPPAMMSGYYGRPASFLQQYAGPSHGRSGHERSATQSTAWTETSASELASSAPSSDYTATYGDSGKRSLHF